MKKLISELKARSTPRTFPDSEAYQGISVRDVETLSEQFRICGKDVEIAALENQIVPERYSRNMKTLSLEDQINLLKSRVTVAGLGGLGGTVTEILAREGIGTLKLVDGDIFEESNLNRQLFSTLKHLSMPKAHAAAVRASEINSSILIHTHNEFLDEKNAEKIVKESDVVVDCLDNIKTRFILEKAAKNNGIPLVSAAIAGIAGHVTTIFPEDPGLTLIYGDPDFLEEKGAERSLGCLPHAITILSALECSEVIKILLKNGEPLRNRLLIADLGDNTFDVLDIWHK